MAFLGNIDKKDAAKILKEFRELSATFCFFPNKKALLRKEGADSGNCSSKTCAELEKKMLQHESLELPHFVLIQPRTSGLELNFFLTIVALLMTW